MRSLFLSPRSVAFVGISRSNGPGALDPVENLRAWGYEGKVQVVHPHAAEIAGIRTVARNSDLEHPVDLCVIASPRETAPGLVEECSRAGIRAVIVVNQGFGDADARGRELQRAVADAARRGGSRVLGPNTLGVANAFHRFHTSFMPLVREEGPVGLVCQSGTFFVGARGFTGGMGQGVDVGNACDLDLADGLEWVGSDPRVRLVAVHAEGIPDGRRFLETGAQVARRKPVLVLKTGRSSPGARAAASHTGSLAGEDRVVDGALRGAGLIRVEGIDDLLDLSRGFLRLPPMGGRRVAVLTFTGGGGILALDALDPWGLRTAPLAAESLARIRALSPEWMPLGNPLDTWPAMMKHGVRSVFGEALRDATRDPSVDGILCIALGARMPEMAPLDVMDTVAEASLATEKPIVVWVYGPEAPEARERLEARGRALAVHTPERGARLLARMAEYEAWRGRWEGRGCGSPPG